MTSAYCYCVELLCMFSLFPCTLCSLVFSHIQYTPVGRSTAVNCPRCICEWGALRWTCHPSQGVFWLCALSHLGLFRLHLNEWLLKPGAGLPSDATGKSESCSASSGCEGWHTVSPWSFRATLDNQDSTFNQQIEVFPFFPPLISINVFKYNYSVMLMIQLQLCLSSKWTHFNHTISNSLVPIHP